MAGRLAERDGQGAAASTLEKQVDSLDDTAAEDDAFGIVEVDHASQAVAQIVGSLGDNLDSQGVVLLNGIGQQAGADDGLALFQLLCGLVRQHGFAPVMDFGHNGSGDGGARGVGFQTAAIAAAAQAPARFNGHIYTGMTGTAGEIGHTGIDMPIAHDSSANSCAYEDTDKIF